MAHICQSCRKRLRRASDASGGEDEGSEWDGGSGDDESSSDRSTSDGGYSSDAGGEWDDADEDAYKQVCHSYGSPRGC